MSPSVNKLFKLTFRKVSLRVLIELRYSIINQMDESGPSKYNETIQNKDARNKVAPKLMKGKLLSNRSSQVFTGSSSANWCKQPSTISLGTAWRNCLLSLEFLGIPAIFFMKFIKAYSLFGIKLLQVVMLRESHNNAW